MAHSRRMSAGGRPKFAFVDSGLSTFNSSPAIRSARYLAVCTTRGCYIEGTLSGRQFADLTTAQTVVLSLTDSEKQGVTFHLPTAGSRAAIEGP